MVILDKYNHFVDMNLYDLSEFSIFLFSFFFEIAITTSKSLSIGIHGTVAFDYFYASSFIAFRWFILGLGLWS